MAETMVAVEVVEGWQRRRHKVARAWRLMARVGGIGGTHGGCLRFGGAWMMHNYVMA